MLISFQKAFLATLALGVLLLSLAIAARGPAAAATIVVPPGSGGPAQGVLTTGEATIKMRPDIAIIAVGATAQAATAADAQGQAAQRVARILERAKALGVADKDIRNGGYSIQPQYAYAPGAAPKITGYQANQQLVLTYRKVDDAGRAIDALVQNDGATNAGVQFALEDPKAAQADARRMAVADARAKAQAMADAAGVKLGPAQSVSDQQTPAGPVFDAMKRLDAAQPSPAQTQIPVSDLDIVIRVAVQFAIG
ncbi:MAG TPA: SIMPL domain-containing protein [Candidatus Limnocylindria bacterium]|nr:SIMPL domain-containing protein [Candidatus Limnocylindria bacterium]